jgi:hypothetical protein
MQTVRTTWLIVALASLGAIGLIFDKLGSTDVAGTFILAELGLFAVAFMGTLVSGRSGLVMTVGIGLGFLFATLAAVSTSGSCSESDFICFSPGEVFVFGLIAAGALYPGWVLGVGIGSLVRGMSAGGSNR